LLTNVNIVKDTVQISIREHYEGQYISLLLVCTWFWAWFNLLIKWVNSAKKSDTSVNFNVRFHNNWFTN